MTHNTFCVMCHNPPMLCQCNPEPMRKYTVQDYTMFLGEKPMNDLVNNPAHYKDGGIETIDFIEAKNLNYRLGNVIKYVSRAGKKDSMVQDLEKARWYLDREISKLKEKNT